MFYIGTYISHLKLRLVKAEECLSEFDAEQSQIEPRDDHATQVVERRSI